MKWPDKTLLTGIARAGGGALIFAIPMLMTLEMWSLGHSAATGDSPVVDAAPPHRPRPLCRIPRESSRFPDHLADALVSVGVAALIAAILLGIFGLLDAGMVLRVEGYTDP